MKGTKITKFVLFSVLILFLSNLPPVSAQLITLYPTTFDNLTADWDGTASDLNNSATANILNETNGNPAFIGIANFTNVPSQATTWTLTVIHQYNGSVGHANNVLYQYFSTAGAWETWATATNDVFETLTATIDASLIRLPDGNISLRDIHNTGGTTSHTEQLNLISISAIVPTPEVIHVHFVGDPPSACSLCEVSIHWSNSSLKQNLNFTIDDGTITEFCTQCTDEHLILEGLSIGPHNLTVISSTLGNTTKKFIIVNSTWWNYTEWAAAVWQHNETERTTNNWFDRVLGGDIMTNEILFFLILTGALLWLGFKTPGRANLPFFGFAAISLTVIGIFILVTAPFDSFGIDIAGRNLLDITAVFIFWGLAGILTMYAGLGEWRRIQKS